MTLLEVLISIGVLVFGLWGVAMLIPLGKLALNETEKSDRTGACGRAALREVEVRKMLNFTSVWQPNTYYPQNVIVRPTDPANNSLYMCEVPGTSNSNPANEPAWPPAVNDTVNDNGITWRNVGLSTAALPFVIDPLGVANGMTANLGGTASNLLRINLFSTPMANQADPIFRWSDELTFDTPADATMRPRVLARDSAGNVAPWPHLPTDPAVPVLIPPLEYANAGNFSWFLTVAPVTGEATLSVPQKKLYSVAVVVCNRRLFSVDGERTILGATCESSPSYGGVGVQFFGNGTANNLPVRNNEWVLLYSAAALTQCSWYRVVHAGVEPEPFTDANTNGYYDVGETYTDTNGNGVYDPARVTLVGPDWNGGNVAHDARIVVVGGVTGVYTTTIQLDNDLIWSR